MYPLRSWTLPFSPRLDTLARMWKSILSRLLQVCDYDISAAERGIVYIDEIDKISRKGDNPSITRDVSGEGVQQAMLKMLEGTEVNVPPQGGRKHPEQKLVKINTEKNPIYLWWRLPTVSRNSSPAESTPQVIGYRHKELKLIDRDNLLQYINHQDLKSFGLIPELIGRLPVLTYLSPLDMDAMKRILVEPKKCIDQTISEII